MSYIWTSQNPQNSEWHANTVLQKSQDQYVKSWFASVNESSKCVNYRMYKTEHKFENYLITLPPKLRNILLTIVSVTISFQLKHEDG